MQVTRRRRRDGEVRPPSSADASAAGSAGHGGRRRGRLAVTGAGIAVASTAAVRHPPGRPDHRQGPGRLRATSTSAPYGNRLVINNGKIMSSSVSPDGTHLAASVTDGGAALAIVDLQELEGAAARRQLRVGDLRISGNDVGQEGPTYSPDGTQLWLGRTDGYTKFTVNPDGTARQPGRPSRSRRTAPKHALVGEAVFSADGSTVYSAVNGQNRVVAIDAATGAITAELDRGQRPARPGPWSAASSTSATRAAARPSPARPRSTPTAPRCRPTR